MDSDLPVEGKYKIYCYICGKETDKNRVSGDQEKFRSEPQEAADAGFYLTSDIDIEPVTCSEVFCQTTFNNLPTSGQYDYGVPYQSDVLIDQKSFSTIPQIYNERFVDENQTIAILFQEYKTDHASKLEALLQGWLFFGVLREYLGDHYVHDDYVRTNEQGNQFLSLKHLTTAIARWMNAVPRFGPDAEQIFSSRNNVLAVSGRVLFAVKSCAFNENLRELLATTAEILAWTLSILFHKKSVDRGFLGYVGELQSTSLTDLGWCAREAYTATKTMSTLATRFLHQQTNRRGRSPGHQSCSEKKCRASSEVYDNSGGPAHCTDCQKTDCGIVRLGETEMQQMCSILKADSYPLLEVKIDATTGPPHLEVVPFSADCSYIAISHVWAQGLGNEDDNSLRECQLRRLLRHMKQLWCLMYPQGHKRLLFWLDTFCCPVDSRASSQFRKLAISSMRKTYKAASAVLVLDTELESLNTVNRSPNEIACHIFVSSWVSRLWTMQEGQLPEELWFAFKDNMLNAHTLYLALRALRCGIDVRERIIASEMLLRFHGTRTLCGRYIRSGAEQELAIVANGMPFREVKHEKDEAICISTLFNLDTSQILKYESHEERMRDVWLQLSSRKLIPRSMAFSVGPKLNLTGYKWANSTLRNERVPPAFRSSSLVKGIATEEGLMVVAGGVTFVTAPAVEGFDITHYGIKPPYQETFVLKTTNNGYQMFSALDVEMDPSVKYDNLWNNLEHPNRPLALLRKHLSKDLISRDDGTCVLVEIQRKDESRIYCKRLRLGSLKSLPRNQEASIALAIHQAENLRDHPLFEELRQLNHLPNNQETQSRRSHIHLKSLPPLLEFEKSLLEVDSIPEDIRRLGPDETYALRLGIILAGKYTVTVEDIPEDVEWYVD